MSRFLERPSDLYQKAVHILTQLAEQEGRYIAERAFEEAIEKYRYKAFIDRYGVKRSSGHTCINRLLGKWCIGLSGNCHLPAANDHISFWLKDGKPYLYVSQPYDLSLEDMRKLVPFCDEHDLDLTVTASNSWHSPGHTLLIVVSRRKAGNL